MSIARSRSAWLLGLYFITVSLSGSTTASDVKAPALEIKAMKAMLFYEDKGSFSADVSDADNGPPYVPPKLWNTPMQYENRATSVLVTIEVTGEAELTPEPKLEFTARYIPLGRESKEVVIRRIVSVRIPVKVREHDNFNAGFWLYNVGCNPVKLRARIMGQREASTTKRVIKFDCGE